MKVGHVDTKAVLIPGDLKADYESAGVEREFVYNGYHVRKIIERVGRAEAALSELIVHVNSLPEGHYSAWLTWWARENAALAKPNA